jgi:F-type H+-transporting ATPase subunit gamma
MAQTREIKKRMTAVNTIQRITKTMQMIATGRFQKLQKKAHQAQAYADRLAEMVRQVAAAVAASGASDVSHPLTDARPRPDAPTLLLVLTSDRGLAGSYNANVLRMVARLLGEELPADRRRLEVVGKKGVGYFKFQRVAVQQIHTQFGDNPKVPDIHALADRFMTEFAEGKYAAVKVAYTRFLSAGRQRPEITTLLPLQGPVDEEAPAAPVLYEFSPDAATLLAELLPATVRTTLQRCFSDAVVSEQVARMVAMKSATDAAGKQGKRFQRQYNRARQTAITTELSEIIGGAAALKN